MKEIWNVVCIGEDGEYWYIHATCASKRLAEQIAEQANEQWDETESYREYIVESSVYYETIPQNLYYARESAFMLALTRKDEDE